VFFHTRIPGRDSVALKVNFAMKKKAAAKGKQSSPTPLKNKSLSLATPKGAPVKSAPRPEIKLDPAFTQAVQNFEAGMKLLQAQKFDKAEPLLMKVVSGPDKALADRARVYLNICKQQNASSSTSFKSAEEQYDYAVALMNRGDYEEARNLLQKILKNNPKADHAIYGLAVLDCLCGRVEECLRTLQQAITLNPSLRFQARNDSDFSGVADDPRFTELIYPEPTDASQGR
jgi:tetratricopeptide (TPR) repeat protein